MLAGQSLDDARTALRTGSYDEALEAYADLVRGGAPLTVGREYARALMEVGRYQDAIAYLQGAGSVALDNVLGEALFTVGRVQEAEAAFQRAMDGRAQDREVARLNLAYSLLSRGQREAAFQIFDSFIDLYNGSRALSAEELMAVGSAVK